MTDHLRVEVILPTHNGQRWVAEAIESVLGQTHPAWHLTVVDDHSDDATVGIIESMQVEHAQRISVICLGYRHRAAGARMVAVESTSSDLIAFIDQDDRWHPEKLSIQEVDFLDDPSLGASHTDIEIIDEDGFAVAAAADNENQLRAEVNWDDPELASSLFWKLSIRLVSSVISRHAFEDVGGFDSSLYGWEDDEFWVRLAALHTIRHVPQHLVQRRVHPLNTSAVDAFERLDGSFKAVKKIVDEHPDFAHLAPQVRYKLHRRGLELALRRRRPLRAMRYGARLATNRLMRRGKGLASKPPDAPQQRST